MRSNWVGRPVSCHVPSPLGGASDPGGRLRHSRPSPAAGRAFHTSHPVRRPEARDSRQAGRGVDRELAQLRRRPGRRPAADPATRRLQLCTPGASPVSLPRRIRAALFRGNSIPWTRGLEQHFKGIRYPRSKQMSPSAWQNSCNYHSHLYMAFTFDCCFNQCTVNRVVTHVTASHVRHSENRAASQIYRYYYGYCYCSATGGAGTSTADDSLLARFQDT